MPEAARGEGLASEPAAIAPEADERAHTAGAQSINVRLHSGRSRFCHGMRIALSLGRVCITPPCVG